MSISPLFRPLVPASALIAGLSLVAIPGHAQTFSNPTVITINESGAASPYPSDIEVSGVAELVGKVTVEISGFGHEWPADVDILLVGPDGQSVVLMSDAGGSVVTSDVSLVFDDDAADPLVENVALVDGTYQPTNIAGTVTDPFVAPAPVLPSGTTLSIFAGTDPNGVWSLYVIDDGLEESGTIAGGWSITVPEPASAGQGAALLALAALAVRRRTSARR